VAAREALDTQAAMAETLVGYACSQVSLGVADALILDFGDLELNPVGDLAGAIVLAVECPWRIDGSDQPAVGWEDEEEDIAHLSSVLIGGVVDEIDVRRPGFDLTIQFSHGYRLRIFPDCRAYYSDEMSGGAVPWQLVHRGVAGEPQGNSTSH
jgi:hypothetical protein